MLNLLTVGFEFRDVFYYSLIRVKDKAVGTDYEITVMNGKLEKLLYGNHVIKQRNGCLVVEVTEPTEQGLLKQSIAEALSNFLHVPLEQKMSTEIPRPSTELRSSTVYDA
jgi:hypothetical protein